MTVNVNLVVVCGFTGCPWSMEIDRSSGADPMAVHEAYLEHLDVHDPDGADIDSADHWVNTFQAIIQECSSCHAKPGEPHTDYCKLPQWAAHDAEVARALAEDRTLGGGIYTGRLYPSFTCPRCQKTSYHPEDVKHGYCGHCHDWTRPGGGLYAGDTPEQIAAEQDRINRFMAGDEAQ